MLYIGCAIWAYDGWANNFFPQGLPKDERLRSYANRLTAVEGNNTFYATPTLGAVQKWASDTPETFRFCPKFPKAISHTAQLRNVEAQTASFLGVMRALGPRLGPLMLQLPPSFSPGKLGLLRDYLAHLPRGLEVAVEVRHPDWFVVPHASALDDALAATGAARLCFDSRPVYASKAPEAVLAQEKKPDVPLVAAATQPFVVVRYISSPIVEENAPYFAEWAPRLAAWLGEGRRVYCFVHCPVEELSPGLARDLYHMVSAEVDATRVAPALSVLPWDQADTPTDETDLTQLSLF